MVNIILQVFVLANFALLPCMGQVQRASLDFTKATQNPETGGLCVLQEICIDDLAALASKLPPGPCVQNDGCNCGTDEDCGGGSNRCVSCNCMDCPASASSSVVLNPPLTFVIDTTKSVKPDKDSIFNLTQRVVERIQETNTNIPSYLLVTFNDHGPDITLNVDVHPPTDDVIRFRQETISLEFESYDGGRDSKERLLQGLLIACKETPEKSLVVVFTDNGSKDLILRNEILNLKKEKNLEIYIVLTPMYEGWPNAKSLTVYDELAQVFNIADVGADAFLSSIEEFEEGNCL